MRKTRFLFLVAAVALPMALSAQAPKGEKKPPIGGSDMVSLAATVEAIDYTARQVTLKGPEGNTVTLHVPDSVTRFSAMKVGDKVKARYYQAVAVDVHKADGTAPPADKVESGVKKAEGAKPAGTATRKLTITVTIQAIDPKAPSVTVKDQDGHVSSYRVQDPKNLEGVSVGDRVVITYTEALAIEVTEPKP